MLLGGSLHNRKPETRTDQKRKGISTVTLEASQACTAQSCRLETAAGLSLDCGAEKRHIFLEKDRQCQERYRRNPVTRGRRVRGAGSVGSLLNLLETVRDFPI